MTRSRLAGLALVFVLARATNAPAQVALDEDEKLQLFGDLRLRFESDWDSRRADGRERADRDRMRIRARIGLTYDPTEAISFGFRLRTGETTAQQSPHLTILDFDDNPTGDREVVPDRWFLRFRANDTTAWLGRDAYPFWKQNELFWDDDVTLAGGTLRQRFRPGGDQLDLIGGVYVLPDGMLDFYGSMAAGQLVYATNLESARLTLASGLYFLQAGDGVAHLRQGNGSRGYELWISGAEARFARDRWPLRLGFDVSFNLEDYSPDDPDPVTAANHDQTTGLVLNVTLGQTSAPWEWLVAYYYARVETLAVNASFAQDDWIRWGASGQTDASDLKGSEFRFGMRLPGRLNLLARLYLVEAITSVQDGKRFRVDLNYGF